MKVKIDGLNEVRRNILKHAKKAELAQVHALTDEADAIYNKSVDIVPLDESTLQHTGRVLGPFVDLHRVWLAVQYGGGPAAQYAVRQHEDTTLNHDNGREAKYLERPANEAEHGMERRVARKVRRAVGN